jgi:tRNA(Ile)-lysidine synthase
MPAIVLKRVNYFIQHYNLIHPGDHILVAVSGGADSVALLSILKELSPRLRLRLTVAHLNHQIRGRDADKDEQFVRQLARKLRLTFAGGKVNVPRLAGRLGISLEMAGRKARYAFFEKAARKHGCDVVATAHTADDAVEGVLVMLIRGCGLQGLTGMAPSGRVVKIKIIRPLLETDRKTIEKYLHARNIAWREDMSNRDLSFMRNRVRHELLPLLEKKYNKGIKGCLHRMSGMLREENDFIEHFTEKAYTKACLKSLIERKSTGFLDSRFHGNDRLDASVCHSRLDATLRSKPSLRSTSRESRSSLNRLDLNIRKLCNHHIAIRRRVLRRWLLANGVDNQTIDFQLINRIDDMIMRSGKGRVVSLTGGMKVKRSNDYLAIEKRPERVAGKYRVKIKIPGTTLLPGIGLRVKAEICPGICRVRGKFGKYPARASLSLKKWRKRQILARTWRAGDRMCPYGLVGSKKVQDIFSDAKVPVERKHYQPIFECGGEIIWIPGYRIARGWEVLPAEKKALQLIVDHSCRTNREVMHS